MLALKLKCQSCGANKVNEITTGYIYCDYCAAFMGFEMQKLQEEAAEKFGKDSDMKNETAQYNQAAIELGVAIKEQNSDKFIEAQLKIHKLQFLLFPKQFSPKMKQPAYQEKFINYYRKFWSENIDKGYFEKNKESSEKYAELSSKLNYTIVDNAPLFTWDKNFEEYVKVISENTKLSIEDTLSMDSMQYYPEPVTPATPDLLYKQGINGMIQNFSQDIAQKVVEYLDLKSEYIEINDVVISEKDCVVCGSGLKIPENSKAVFCESCGSSVEHSTGQIDCVNCAAKYNPAETSNTCPYCNSKVISLGKKTQTDPGVKTQTKQEKPSQKKGGFFSKLFGKG